jgi:hypothetical protein
MITDRNFTLLFEFSRFSIAPVRVIERACRSTDRFRSQQAEQFAWGMGVSLQRDSPGRLKSKQPAKRQSRGATDVLKCDGAETDEKVDSVAKARPGATRWPDNLCEWLYTSWAVGQRFECPLAVKRGRSRRLADHERVHQALCVLERLRQSLVSVAEIVDADGRVGEDYEAVRRIARRRGIVRKSCSVPPSRASRRPFSIAISALRPARTGAVFSVMRVNLRASANKASSMLRVVLIRINTAHGYISGKPEG